MDAENGSETQSAEAPAKKATLAEAAALFGVGVKNSAEQVGYWLEHGRAAEARTALALLKERLVAAETALEAATEIPVAVDGSAARPQS